MRSVFACVVLAITVIMTGFLSPIGDAEAGVTVRIDRGSQSMRVYINNSLQHVWSVSTGRRGYSTPRGSFRPQRLARKWFSRKYHWSPMPHSIFFYKGYAIHGTTHIRNLGRRASHGCIRLHPSNARRLFSLVRRYGQKNTRIYIR